MKIWLITDTHFNHKNIVALSGRPEDYQDQLIRNWSSMVAPEDLTIHLGDVIFSRASELKGILDQIPGRKILVKGNHDKRPEWYMKNGFDFACHRFELNHCIFTHEPQFSKPDHIDMVIHGHLHNNGHRTDEYPEPIPSFNKLLAVEYTDYKPIELTKFMEEAYAQDSN